MSIFKRFSHKQSPEGPASPPGSTETALSLPASPVARPRSDTDPDTCLEVFKSHWKRVLNIFNGHNSPSRNTTASRQQAEDIEAVMRYVDQMNILLIEEKSSDGSQGPILEYLLVEDIMAHLVQWGLNTAPLLPETPQRLKLYLLKIYELVISQARQPILLHKPIIRPLFKLLSICSDETKGRMSVAVETRLILILHQLCVCVTQNKQILELLFNATTDHGVSGFLMFSLLIPYTHREGAIGQQARDALLLIMALSFSHEDIGMYIAEKSHFCPVLATGLSGLYSSLPRKLNYPSDDWYQLSDTDINDIPDLIMFLNSLEFCNAVVQVAHPLVREKLLSFICNGFLVPVLGPALHQNDVRFYDDPDLFLDDDADDYNAENRFMDLLKLPVSVLDSYYTTSVEEVIAATAYTELFIRRITEPALIRTFLIFILMEKYDDKIILESLIERINSNSRLCMITLSLFQTLIDLNCEDVMFQLIFKYLIPCTHVMVSQRKAIRDLDLYGKASQKLFSLTPTCCMDGADGNPEPKPDLVLPVSFEPIPCPLPQPAEPKKRFQFFRKKSQQSNNSALLAISEHWAHNHDAADDTTSPNDNTSLCSVDARNSSPDTVSIASTSSLQTTDQLKYESHYMEYLKNAREKISHCAFSCACWHHLYDGEDPSPDTLPSAFSLLEPDSSHFLADPAEKEDDNTTGPTSSPDSLATSDADSALSANTCVSRSDSPLNDDFTQQEFSAFILQLKRVKTPVEFSDNIEQSLSEMDALLSQALSSPQTILPVVESCEPTATTAPLSSPSIKHSSVPSLSTLNISPTTATSAPNIGPFLITLLHKLECLMQNSLYVNLLLTGLLCRLACYPQPLLRSFLLNHSLVFQPSVKSLVQVLSSVKHKIDAYAYTIKDFDQLLAKARRFLAWREDIFLHGNDHARPRSDSTLSLQSVKSNHSKDRKRGSAIGDFLFGRKNQPSAMPPASRLQLLSDNKGFRYFNLHSQQQQDSSDPMEAVRTKNAVYCALVFEEFLKELSAVAQEHSVLAEVF